MKVKTMIEFLERIFPKTMRRYWYGARDTGYRHGMNTVTAFIHAEIKVLSKTDNRESRNRINELMYVLAKIKQAGE